MMSQKPGTVSSLAVIAASMWHKEGQVRLLELSKCSQRFARDKKTKSAVQKSGWHPIGRLCSKWQEILWGACLYNWIVILATACLVWPARHFHSETHSLHIGKNCMHLFTHFSVSCVRAQGCASPLDSIVFILHTHPPGFPYILVVKLDEAWDPVSATGNQELPIALPIWNSAIVYEEWTCLNLCNTGIQKFMPNLCNTYEQSCKRQRVLTEVPCAPYSLHYFVFKSELDITVLTVASQLIGTLRRSCSIFHGAKDGDVLCIFSTQHGLQ